MWIKASGKSLKNFSKEEIYVDVNLKSNVTNKIRNELKLRPSIETSMHSILDYKYVIHLHSVRHIAYSSSNYYSNNKFQSKFIFRVPYHKPGQPLANQIKKIIKMETSPKKFIFFILNNHGILIGLNTISEFDNVLNLMPIKLKINSNYQRNSKIINSKKYINCSDKFESVPKFEKQEIHYIEKSVRFCPDNIVFIDHIIPLLNKNDNIDLYDNNLIYIKNFGFYSLRKTNKIIDEQIQFYFDVISLVGNLADLNVLSDNETNEIVNWESEKYRKKLITKSK